MVGNKTLSAASTVRSFYGVPMLMNVALASGACSAASAQDRSQAEAYRIIASKQFVDLTHSFSPLTPVWKGFGPDVLQLWRGKPVG